jgi:hypothetical protein
MMVLGSSIALHKFKRKRLSRPALNYLLVVAVVFLGLILRTTYSLTIILALLGTARGC